MTLLRILGCSRSTECCRITWCKQIWNLPNTRRNSTIFKRTVTALQLPLYFPHVPPPPLYTIYMQGAMHPSPLHTIPATLYLLCSRCQAVSSPAAVGVLISSQQLQTSFWQSVYFFPYCAPLIDKGAVSFSHCPATSLLVPSCFLSSQLINPGAQCSSPSHSGPFGTGHHHSDHLARNP